MMKALKLLALVLLCSCNSDIKNAHVFGMVVDHNTRKPLQGIKLLVNAAYYEGGDYDSYNGYVDTVLITDEKGRFEAVFEKIAYLQIRVKIAQRDSLLYVDEVHGKEQQIDLTLTPAPSTEAYR